MSRSLRLSSLALLATSLACTLSVPFLEAAPGSGNVITINNDATGFDQVVISHAFKATIQQGDSFSVVIRRR